MPCWEKSGRYYKSTCSSLLLLLPLTGVTAPTWAYSPLIQGLCHRRCGRIEVAKYKTCCHCHCCAYQNRLEQDGEGILPSPTGTPCPSSRRFSITSFHEMVFSICTWISRHLCGFSCLQVLVRSLCLTPDLRVTLRSIVGNLCLPTQSGDNYGNFEAGSKGVGALISFLLAPTYSL